MKRARTAFRSIVSLSAMVIILLNASVASASEVKRIGGATFTGTYAEDLSLSVDNDSFFQAFISGPGDRWESHITIKNGGKKDIQVSFLEIRDKLNDPVLLEALDLKILLNDKKVVYEGKYASTTSPLIDWFPLKAGQEEVLTIFTSFPGTCGNAYQAKQFSTDWIFEVRADEPAAPGTQKSTDKPDEQVSRTPDKSSSPSPDQTSERSNQSNGNPNHSSQDDSSQKESIVLTGDTLPVMLYVIIIVAAAIAALGVLLGTKKAGKEDDIDEWQI